MHKNLLFLALFILISLFGKAQTPLTNTNWYLIQIEKNNQFYNVLFHQMERQAEIGIFKFCHHLPKKKMLN